MENIGRYEVVERLGSGGFATVYLVRDPVLDSEVAVKVLAENWSDKVDLRDRFIREAQLLRRIDSERVVTVHDIGELPSGQPYFVMALVDRGTLDERLAQMPPPEASDIANVGRQLAECLGTIHSNDLIHRDIKPSNLLIAGPRQVARDTEVGLLRPSERLVLGDFGLAKDIALQSTVGFTISAGTGGYAAPEQMSPVGVPGRQTDLYAATGVMYRVMTAETPPPFDLVTETVPFPDGASWMAGELGRFFRQGMAFHPERRHPSVESWLSDLEAVIPGFDPGAADLTAPTQRSGWSGQGTQPSWEVPNSPSGGSGSGPSSDPRSWAPPPSPGGQPRIENPPSLPQVSVPSVGGPVTPPPFAPPQPLVQSGHTRPQSQMPGYPQTSPGQAHNPYGHPQQAPPQHSQPQYGQTPYGQPNYQQARPKRRVGRVLLGLLLVAALAGAGAWFAFLQPQGPEVVGPTEIEAGESASYAASFEGASEYEWTDWNGGTVVQSDPFLVNALAPGSLTFSVAAVTDGDGRSASTRHTITIVDAVDGPRIVGPTIVLIGDVADYTFTAPDGATNPRWRDSSGEQFGDNYTLRPSGAGTFRVILIVTRADGTDVGTAIDIDFIEP